MISVLAIAVINTNKMYWCKWCTALSRLSQQGNLNVSRVLSRSGQHKTSLYGKLYHKQNSNFIDDIEIGVQRKTSG